MANNHSQSFFGQTNGIILSSPSKTDPFIFLRCIKKKPDGIWEKPSLGEGKTIRCSLEEIVMILQVLEGKTPSWSGYHKYKEKNTQISVNWEGNSQDKLWIRVGDYSKMFGFSQVEILRLLLIHILKEKIEFATSSKKFQPNINNNNNKSVNIKPDELVIVEEIKTPPVGNDMEMLFIEETIKSSSSSGNNGNEKRKLRGSIKTETAKALLIMLPSGREQWFPKTTVSAQYNPEKEIEQIFLIDKWILEKNKIV